MLKRSGFIALAATDLAVVTYALFGPSLVAGVLTARYLVIAALVAMGLVLRPFLSLGAGGGALPPPWQLYLGSPAAIAAGMAAACFSGAGAGLSLLQLCRPVPRLRLPAILCSAAGLAGAYGGSWLR